MDTYRDWYPILNSSLPMSCCETQPGAVGHEICNETVFTLYRSSCLTTLSSIIKENATTLGITGIAIAMAQVKIFFLNILIAFSLRCNSKLLIELLFQILGVCFSCALAKRIRNNYENFE